MALPRIVKNYLTVSSGVAFGQALSFLVMPVLSRYYSTESFGVMGTFVSVASILGTMATLQYGVALMLPKRDTEAANVFLLGSGAVVVTTLLVSLVLVLFPDGCCALLKAPGNIFLVLLPLFVMFNGTNQMLIGWSVRRKQFKANSASQVVRSFTVNSVQVVGGTVLPTGGMLATGAVLGEIGSCLNLGYLFWKNETRFFARCYSKDWMKQLAKAYYDFPLFSTPQNLLNAVSQGLPVLLLGHYHGIAAAGLYAFGIRLVQAPLSLLLNPLRQVLFQKFCEVQNKGVSVLPLFRMTTLGLLAVILVPMVLGIFFMPEIFALFFGEKWRIAGDFARWMLVWLCIGFCNVPSVLIARILRMQHQMLLFDILALCLRTIILVLGGLFLSDKETVAAFCLLGALLNLVLIAWVWFRLKHEKLPTQRFVKGFDLA